jgi:hypothetical protein
MIGLRPTESRLGARQHLHLRAGSAPGAGPGSTSDRGNADDRLLAPLRRHRGWTFLGLIVAAAAMATRFVAIGVLPPSINVKAFAHATASTKLVLGANSAFGYSTTAREPYSTLSTRTYTLADIVDSPEITEYVARAAGLPVSKIGILGPQWVELQRDQQFPSGPQRDRQIIIEKDPYQITIDQDTTQPGEGQGAGSGPPVIDVESQAPSTEIAARLASAVPAALHAYVEHAQAMAGVPERDRYDVSQLVPVSVSPARKSQLADVGVFTFFAVFVLWCGAEIAVFSLVRDLRRTAAALEGGDSSDRWSDSGPLLPEAR